MAQILVRFLFQFIILCDTERFLLTQPTQIYYLTTSTHILVNVSDIYNKLLSS
jgi:hypothetical protein